eukprot:3038788-Prymnesium_polylepis.1
MVGVHTRPRTSPTQREAPCPARRGVFFFVCRWVGESYLLSWRRDRRYGTAPRAARSTTTSSAPRTTMVRRIQGKRLFCIGGHPNGVGLCAAPSGAML